MHHHPLSVASKICGNVLVKDGLRRGSLGEKIIFLSVVNLKNNPWTLIGAPRTYFIPTVLKDYAEDFLPSSEVIIAFGCCLWSHLVPTRAWLSGNNYIHFFQSSALPTLWPLYTLVCPNRFYSSHGSSSIPSEEPELCFLFENREQLLSAAPGVKDDFGVPHPTAPHCRSL